MWQKFVSCRSWLKEWNRKHKRASSLLATGLKAIPCLLSTLNHQLSTFLVIDMPPRELWAKQTQQRAEKASRRTGAPSRTGVNRSREIDISGEPRFRRRFNQAQKVSAFRNPRTPSINTINPA
jgi:hypothetical protein